MEKDIKPDSRRCFCTVVGVLIFWGAAVWLNTVVTRRSLQLQKVRAHNAELAAKLAHLTSECENLAATKVALKDDPVAVEREARTVFGLVRAGERTYTPINVSIRQLEQRRLGHCGIQHRLAGMLRLWSTDPVSFRYYSLGVLFTAMAAVLLLPAFRGTKRVTGPAAE